MMYSIITVCYNSEKTIGKCIESVLNQKFDDYEYILIDGCSTDNTISIANEYKQKFINKNIDFFIFSEKDKGIYDAMNKGILKANGQWIIYMNSDDKFANENILNTVAKKADAEDVGVIYGNVIVNNSGVLKYQKADYLAELKSGYKMPFCHQSTFTRRKILVKYMFDISYKIIADIDLYLKLYEDGIKFQYIDKYISIFSNDGISQTRRIESILEGKRMLKNHNELTLKRKIKLDEYLVWYGIKKYLPKNIIKLIESVKR